MRLGRYRQGVTPNTFAPEGAQRCRAGASGLFQDRSAVHKSHLLRERAETRGASGLSQGKTKRPNPGQKSMKITRRRIFLGLAGLADLQGAEAAYQAALRLRRERHVTTAADRDDVVAPREGPAESYAEPSARSGEEADAPSLASHDSAAFAGFSHPGEHDQERREERADVRGAAG